MIGIATIKKVLVSMELENYEIKKHCEPLFERLGKMFEPFAGAVTVDHKLANINPFVTSWDMLSHSDQYMFICIARGKNEDMFRRMQPLSLMKWSDFDLTEQAAILTACDRAVCAAFTLYNDAAVTYNYKTAFIAAVKERGANEAQEVMEALRAA
jgi:hypothetical protein